MKRIALSIGIASALVASCSVKEENFETPQQDDVIYYASFEQPAEDGTRVYANEDLLLRWTADDRVSIFGKNTLNQQYKYLGETGDNSGSFSKVDGAEYVTGNPISHTVSVYPYQESTKITEDEVLKVTLPAEQHYAENTFGIGDNTMVSVSSDNVLQYKNVGGYLMLKLYGEGVSVSSITLKGNNGEKLAGKATVTMPLGGTPSAVMADDATDQISLVCDTPVALGATAEDSKDFWLVVPTVTFSKGFTVTVSGNGGVFEKSTEKTVTIERNKLSKMAPIEVELTPTQPRNVIYYTSTDGNVVTPRNDDNQFRANILSNEYVDGLGVITFDGDVTSIGLGAFNGCTSLTSITIPEGVTSIGEYAFENCTSLTSIKIPDSVTSIGNYVFYNCTSLTSITISDGVTSIGASAFNYCTSLTRITIPESVTSIGSWAFGHCSGLTSITIPNGVTSIGNYAFGSCTSLTSITIPDNVTGIGYSAFFHCSSLMSFSGKYSSPDGLFLIDSGIIIAVACGAINGEITIPNGVTSIGDNAFNGCSSLTSITIPGGMTGIGNSAFYGCTGLTSITIPEGVTSIGSGAFWGCPSLASITVKPKVPPSGGSIMFSNTNNAPIYVPVGSVEAYKSAPYWSDYADRIQAIPSSSSSVPVPEAVDLGLPSGVKWASFNLGASKPEEYGDYFAWGETEPYYSSLDPLTWKEGKEAGYFWGSYKWFVGPNTNFTKYCSISSYGYNGITDTKTVLDSEDDAAHINLGGSWRMPTDAEWNELLGDCTWEWTSMNGINGRKVTGPNGESIFLPASGHRVNTELLWLGVEGNYWSSTLYSDNPQSSLLVYFDSSVAGRYTWGRYHGVSIRPVYDE